MAKTTDKASPPEQFERVSLVLGVDQLEALRRHRESNGVSVSHQIRSAIQDYLEERMPR